MQGKYRLKVVHLTGTAQRSLKERYVGSETVDKEAGGNREVVLPV